MAHANPKQAELDKSGLIQKLPVFSYINAKKESVDTAKTFDELRNEIVDDLPELDDATAVLCKLTCETNIIRVLRVVVFDPEFSSKLYWFAKKQWDGKDWEL